MIRFDAKLEQFREQGEKTGWTYLEVPAELAIQLQPGSKKSLRVKGMIDAHPIKGVSLLPMGGGNFILAVNAEMRKKIRKQKGAAVQVKLEVDSQEFSIPGFIQECLNDEPAAKHFFSSLPKGHQRYFVKWIESAKTETTRTRRLARMVTALARKMGYMEMIREGKEDT